MKAILVLLTLAWAGLVSAPAQSPRNASTATAEAPPPALALDPAWTAKLKWRGIGPSVTGGRIVDIAVVESDPSTYYVASASGGLWKTVNNGVTFDPVFERENTVSIGDVAVAPSDPNIVWVGTGEHNARNSVSWGDGVYKSTDAGKTWKNMGLPKSFQIGSIAIHPKNPDIVFVAALGRLWGPNEERGLYRTTDGGKTWDKVLHVDDKTGCMEVTMSPGNPNVLLAAMYERLRDEFDGNDPIKRWGPGSGLYKSSNGGTKWTRLTNGLPTVQLGRIGMSWSHKNPKTVFAIIESEKIGTGPRGTNATGNAYMGITGENADGGAKLLTVVPEAPASDAGLKAGDVITAFDGKPVASYEVLLEKLRDHKSGDKVKFAIKRDDQSVEQEVTLGTRPAGQGAPQNQFAASLGGQNQNVQDRQGPDGFQTGGIYKSTDAGDTWTRVNSLNPRPFYFSRIHVDPSDDRFIYVHGISLFASADGGKSFRADAGRNVHADHHAMWIDPRDGRHMILGCDGGLYATQDRTKTWEFVNNLPLAQFYNVAVDSRRLYHVYGGLQDNGSWGGPSAMRGRTGPMAEDWLPIGGGDGFVCQVDQSDPDLVYYESQGGVMGRINMRTGERGRIRPEPARGQTLRFNWKTPFILSGHNSKVFYCAANFVYRSLDRGEKLRTISPDITRTKKGSGSALAESPLNPDVLWAGSDDGFLWLTRDGGHTWTNLTASITALPGPRWVSTIEASRFKEGRAYVVFDGHRSDDDRPYVFLTDDFGKSWKSLTNGLPEHTTRCLREDTDNANLLFLGTEFGVWVTVDRGANWTKLNNNMPTVAVHDFAVHAKSGEVVAATHGRGLWILDAAPLRQLSKDALAEAHLFKPQPGVLWAGSITRRVYGNQWYAGDNPAPGATIFYSLPEKAGKVSLKILEPDGKLVRDLTPLKSEAGLHQVTWDLRRGRSGTNAPPGAGQTRAAGGGQGRGGQARVAAAQGEAAAGQARNPNAPAGGGALFAGRNLGELFDRLDVNKDGTLTPDEIASDAQAAEALRRFGLDPGQAITREAADRAVTEIMGRIGGGGFGRAAESGKYRVVLTVDGKEQTADIAVQADPEFPDATTMLELEEQEFELWYRKRAKTTN